MKTYNVIWIDDECKEPWGEQFIVDAEQEGLYITEFKVRKEGMDIFLSDIDAWDAIILDAKCFDESIDETTELDGLYNAIDIITENKKRKIIPWFVLSGQADLLDDKQFEKSLRGKKIYNKNLAKDKEKLFADIKREANENIETQIRHKYADIFATNANKPIILKLLKAIRNDDNKNAALLNDIRNILEDILDECVNRGFLLNDSINKRSKEFREKLIVPTHIKRNMYSVTDISQEGSHPSPVRDAVASGAAPYLIDSTVKELLNIILWWDGYKKANP